jgi:hypothetical protein
MVMRPQIEKLRVRIEALAAIGEGASRPVYVWRECWEAEEEVLERHYGRHPEDRRAKHIITFGWAGCSCVRCEAVTPARHIEGVQT